MKTGLVLLVGAVIFAVLLAGNLTRADEVDNPYDAWEEWGETREQKKADSERPRHAPKVNMKPGKKVNMDTLLGSVPKKLQLFFVKGTFGDEYSCNMLVTRWREQLRLGGVEANLGCVKDDGTIVGRAESQRDAHAAKDFLLRHDQVKSIKLDQQEFTEPTVKDDDEDDL